MLDAVEVVVKRSRNDTIPRMSIATYLVNINGNSIKSARNASLTQDGGDHPNQNLKFCSYLTRGRDIFAPSKNSRRILEKLVIPNMKNIRER